MFSFNQGNYFFHYLPTTSHLRGMGDGIWSVAVGGVHQSKNQLQAVISSQISTG